MCAYYTIDPNLNGADQSLAVLRLRETDPGSMTHNPSSSKLDIFLIAVGHAYFPSFTHSEAYLAPNGTRISGGPIPDGLCETFSLLWNVCMRPDWEAAPTIDVGA